MPKLLLADDSPTTQKVVQLTFADEGIDVVVADDGDTALELYDHHHPDVVLADINIPGLNGYEVCEAIRKRETNGSTPVILLAGSFEPFDAEEAHRVGANDYLTKPFSSIRRLVATVAALLDTAVRADETIEETIAPNNVPPSTADEPVAVPLTAEPGAPQPVAEPDMMSTIDIEHLYSQSLVETVEMPHTVAERVLNELSPEDGTALAAEAKLDGIAFDDQLIETEYAAPPTGDNAEARSDDHQAPDIGETTSSASAIPHVDHEEASNESVADVIQVSPEAATEEFQLDQSGEETYFEPAADSISHTPGSGSPAEPVAENVPDVPSQPAVADTATIEQPADSEEPVEPVLTAQEASAEPFEPVEREVPTPWDSIAGPEPSAIAFDESNLLELPAVNRGVSIEDVSAEPTASERSVRDLTSEIVDRIAKETASQVSEELIREIARRVVPRVIEEVLAGKQDEEAR